MENNSWQELWGTPRGLYAESELRILEISFLIAVVLHAGPLGFLFYKQSLKALEEPITLQNVELIEPESERPFAIPAAQPPRSALEFLKMALPIFKKAPEIESIREVAVVPKAKELLIAEPQKLVDKKISPLSKAPEINLDPKLSHSAPKISEITSGINLNQLDRAKTMEPALKLEEVGRRAAGSAPAIQPANIVPKEGSLNLRPLGYSKGSSAAQPIRSPIQEESKQPSKNKLEISKEKVKIVGPLSKRSVIRSYIPEYPAWAKTKNVEADVSVRFNVSAGGDVLSNMVIDRTSGYLELDRLVLDTLKKWKFSSLPNLSENQWGVITFRFRLE